MAGRKICHPQPTLNHQPSTINHQPCMDQGHRRRRRVAGAASTQVTRVAPTVEKIYHVIGTSFPLRNRRIQTLVSPSTKCEVKSIDDDEDARLLLPTFRIHAPHHHTLPFVFLPFQADIKSFNLLSLSRTYHESKYNAQHDGTNNKPVAHTYILLRRFTHSGNIAAIGSAVSLWPPLGTRAKQHLQANVIIV
jgi:hypothetical protein